MALELFFFVTGGVMCSPPNTYRVGGVGNLNNGENKKKSLKWYIITELLLERGGWG